MRSHFALLSTLLLPAAAAALSLGPPLEPPPSPTTPLGPVEIDGPPVDLPPVSAPPFELTLPDPPGDRGERPGDLPDLDLPDGANGPPESLPMGDIPDLVGEVSLPTGAEIVFEVAPPFGGTPGIRGAMRAVPEPGTALLLASGLVALGVRRVRRH